MPTIRSWVKKATMFFINDTSCGKNSGKVFFLVKGSEESLGIYGA